MLTALLTKAIRGVNIRSQHKGGGYFRMSDIVNSYDNAYVTVSVWWHVPPKKSIYMKKKRDR